MRSGGFSEGLAPVQKNGKWGFIDKSGQIAIASQFDYVEKSFNNGTATVKRFSEQFRINKKGEMIVTEEIPPAEGKERE
ncbi:MAG: hypothetical protein OHK0019_08530 [Saprospiraceae bacterium]